MEVRVGHWSGSKKPAGQWRGGGMLTTVRFTSAILLKMILVLFFVVSLFLLLKLVSTGSESRNCVYACGLF